MRKLLRIALLEQPQPCAARAHPQRAAESDSFTQATLVNRHYVYSEQYFKPMQRLISGGE